MEPSAPVLLYDGACGFCDATVRFVLRHDPGGRLRFAALQSPYAVSIVAQFPELAGVDSVVWVDVAADAVARGVLTRSSAALRLAWYLGGWWRVCEILRLIPRPLRDAAYDLFARHRHRIAAAPDRCLVPGPDVRNRFFDVA